jgi:hypothetical protein
MEHPENPIAGVVARDSVGQVHSRRPYPESQGPVRWPPGSSSR